MDAPWLVLLGEILRGTPRLDGASCATVDPRIFDGDDIDQARDICQRCPARTACAAWAETLPSRTVFGLVAGELHEIETQELLLFE
ncbi:WhiB family transcriptional regulator [Mycobacterium sp. MAA66]|uniref:WhiB family transcriptional regulator n=1 Tax=Mycobacterium sp. MAA66 TaxID=3156297 RepID=UPI0035184B88